MMYPNRTILWGFLIPIQVKWFVLIIGTISFLSAIWGGNSGVSEFAHLGGLLFAYIFMKMPRRRNRSRPRRARPPVLSAIGNYSARRRSSRFT